MKDSIDLSVIIPAYNEEKRIEATLADLSEYFVLGPGRDLAYEVVVVNDGSTDGTARIVREYGRKLPGLRLESYGANRGKGYAVRHGMLKARGRHRLFMDADDSVSISTIDRFMRELRRSGAHVAIASIAVEGALVAERNGAHRRILGSISHIVTGAIAPGIRDTQRGFKLFTSEAAEEIFPLQTIDGFGFDVELLVIARRRGFVVRELPVAWNNPDGSKVSLRSYAESFRDLCVVCGNALSGRYSRATSRNDHLRPQTAK